MWDIRNPIISNDGTGLWKFTKDYKGKPNAIVQSTESYGVDAPNKVILKNKRCY